MIDDGIADSLSRDPIRWFRDWAEHKKELGGINVGVFTIWNADTELMYVGVAGRPSRGGAQGAGLVGRLGAHAFGRRSGNQFCIYVADRLVLPMLDRTELDAICDGSLSFDSLVREYIHDNLGFRVAATGDYSRALEIENDIKAGALSAGPPRLNPAESSKPNEAPSE